MLIFYRAEHTIKLHKPTKSPLQSPKTYYCPVEIGQAIEMMVERGYDLTEQGR